MVRIILEQPATADRLAWRICDLLMGEGVTKPAIKALADGLRSHQLDVGWAVATVLRSRAFFASSNLGTRVQSPIEFIVGAVRALELLDPPPSTLVLADWAARLGQDLFNPPNVGGWPGGRSWLSARSLIGRANFATALVDGRGVGRDAPFDPIALAEPSRTRRQPCRDRHVLLRTASRDSTPDARWIDQVGSKTGWNQESARRAVARLLATPEAQLC